MKPSDVRALVVEDNPNWSDMAVRILRTIGCKNIRTAATADEAREMFRAELPHLAVVDIMLPSEQTGFDLIRELHAAEERVRIVAVSVLGGDDYNCLGFRSGVDDYISKTVGVAQLMARLEYQVGRIVEDNPSGRLKWRDVALRLDDGMVEYRRKDGTTGVFPLEGYELRIFRLLMREQGEAYTASELRSLFWGDAAGPGGRVAMLRVKAIRDKFEGVGVECPITTREGGGYAVEPEP